MKTFGNYLLYRLKKTGLMTLVFSLCSAIITVAYVSNAIKQHYNYSPNLDITYTYLGIEIVAIMLGIFSTLIPMLETAEFKNRRNLDTLYFLPMSRFNLALAHYVSGFMQVAFIHTVTFWSAWLYWATHIDSSNYIRSFEYMPLYWPLSLAVGLIIYSVFIFVFGQANNVIDGFIFCVLWIFTIYMVWSSLISIAYGTNLFKDTALNELYDSSIYWSFVYMPINNLTMIFQGIMEVRASGFINDVCRIIDQMYMFFIWLAVATACVFGYFYTFMHKGAEKAGEISNSWFGYKLLLPVYGITGIVRFSYSNIMVLPMFGIIAWILLLLGYIIYRKGFKLKLSDIIILAFLFLIYVGGAIF